MLVVPLGLGTRLARAPLITAIIVAVWAAFFWVDRNDERLMTRLFVAAADADIKAKARALFVDYCLSRHASEENCKNYAILVMPGLPSRQAAKPRAPRPKTLNADETMRRDEIDANLLFDGSLAFELKKAAMLRELLADCKGSKNCFSYKDTLWRFLDIYRSEPSSMMSLPSFAAYHKAATAYRGALREACSMFGCLIRDHITPASVSLAQLRHGSLLHLFGNALVFLVFGIYAEQRTSRLFYCGAIMLGGALGMIVHTKWFAGPDTMSIGGSAMVSVVIGMFYSLFLHNRMRFLVWLPRKLYLGSRFDAPVLWCIPLMFVLSDISGSVDSGFADLLSGRVAYIAHLSGLAFGLSAGWLWLKIDPTPRTYVFQGELRETAQLARESDFVSLLAAAERLAVLSPENFEAKEIACHRLIPMIERDAEGRYYNAWTETLRARAASYLSYHLAGTLAVRTREGRLDRALALVEAMPLDLPLAAAMEHLGQTTALTLADEAIRRQRLHAALRLYDFFLWRYGTAAKAPLVRKTAMAAVQELFAEPRQHTWLARYAKSHQRQLLAAAIEDGLRAKNAA